MTDAVIPETITTPSQVYARIKESCDEYFSQCENAKDKIRGTISTHLVSADFEYDGEHWNTFFFYPLSWNHFPYFLIKSEIVFFRKEGWIVDEYKEGLRFNIPSRVISEGNNT